MGCACSTATEAPSNREVFSTDDFQPEHTLDLNDMGELTHLADGGFCSVYSGFLKSNRVVVKVPRTDNENPEEALLDLDVELTILQLISHPNIVHLMGSGCEPHRFLVLELLAPYTLAHVLGTDKPQDESLTTVIRRRNCLKAFPYITALERGRELAQALQYMHYEACPDLLIIHRDLKAVNIGFSLGGSRLKIFDFGLAKAVPRGGTGDVYAMTGETGSLRYMAPECVRYEPYNEKADIYSMGLLLWEMLVLRRPFEGLGEQEFTRGVVQGTRTPAVPPGWPQSLQDTLRRCWSRDPAVRPTGQEVVNVLTNLIETTPRGV